MKGHEMAAGLAAPRMSRRHGKDGFGYPATPYRVECRPTCGPHTKEQLLRMLDLLAECGAKAWR